MGSLRNEKIEKKRHDSPVPITKVLICLFPFLYFLHDLEEIIRIEPFLQENAALLPVKLTKEEFAFAFTLLWIFASIGCIQAFKGNRFLRMEPITYLSFLIPGILLANGVAHLFQFLLLQAYIPGLITTIIIIIPYSVYTINVLIKKGLSTYKQLLFYFLLGFILQAPLAFSALVISKWTFKWLF